MNRFLFFFFLSQTIGYDNLCYNLTIGGQCASIGVYAYLEFNDQNFELIDIPEQDELLDPQIYWTKPTTLFYANPM